MGKIVRKAIAVVTACIIVLVAAYVFETIRFPVEVKEPLSVVAYPEFLSLYPNTTETFNITVENIASSNYLVCLVFSLNDTAYQQAYVTFPNKTYTVVPGLNNLTAWINIAADAPPAQLELTVELSRVSEKLGYEIRLSSFHFEWVWEWAFVENYTENLDLSFDITPTLSGANLSVTAKYLTIEESGEILPPEYPNSMFLLFDYDGDGELLEEGVSVFCLSWGNTTSPAIVVDGKIAVALMHSPSTFHICYIEGDYLVFKANFSLSALQLQNDLIYIASPELEFSATLHFDPEGILQ